MAWSMRVEDQRGVPVTPDEVVEIAALPFDQDSYPVVSSIDPYDVTVFDPAICRTIVAELRKAESDSEWLAKAGEWRSVREAAERCVAEHLHLRFIGD